MNYQQARFLQSAAKLNQLPPDTGIEIAFAGRSNAGKSTALNRLTGQKHLARTSKTPGRTQLINLFELTPGARLVDLPGYGYAQVPLEIKQRWQHTLSMYLQTRKSLKGLVILSDIRHPLKALDQQMLVWAADAQLPVYLALSKADKLKSGARSRALQQARQQVSALCRDAEIVVAPFSGLNGLGLDTLKQWLDDFFDPPMAE
ncbi:MAG: YihA family ribosome biogenesis GTP-binding protein [Gammaproteobacteria bacterium]|nr:MAG: YihA family ribosome biogenesis GTP-binding protein [Gammaproteobacteria bacterium]